VYQNDSTKAPKIVFVMKGTFQGNNSLVSINYPLIMIGAGQNRTFLTGYPLRIGGTKEDGKEVVVQDLSSSGAENGLSGNNGLSFLCTRMTFTQCRMYGVIAQKTKGRIINCVITQCGMSGICSSMNGLIEMEGSQTKVDGNVTSGNSCCFGLSTYNTSSIIHLLFPLTKESVSTNNHNGNNYNSVGTIKTVDTLLVPYYSNKFT